MMITKMTATVIMMFSLILLVLLELQVGSEAYSTTHFSVAPIKTSTTTLLWRRSKVVDLTQHQLQAQPPTPPPLSASSRLQNVQLFSQSSSTNAATSESDGSNNQDSVLSISSSSLSTMKGITPNGAGALAIPQPSQQQQEQQQQPRNYRAQAGPFSFRTKYGVLNPYGIWYGFVAIFFGIPWFASLALYQGFMVITRGKFDKQRLIPNIFNQIWGTILMRLTRSYPQMDGLDILKEFYAKGKPCMFVANHNSWMDIPIVGSTIGWRNYKFIAKQELAKVPILSRAIRVAGHLMVNRSDKKSGLQTLKAGIQYLKDGVPLCTFPEGTRSRNGRLLGFKNGAFKMAHKAGAPVIPCTIAGAQIAHPVWAIFPIRSSHSLCKITVHEPIESVGKTEEELAEAVRQKMIDGLPEDQKPLS